MLKDLVPELTEILNEHPDFRLDNYDLKEGVYFRFSIDRSFQENIESPVHHLIVRKNTEEDMSKSELTEWFKVRDYYSSILNDDTNKAVDVPAKKIHSTNFLTLFAKRDIMLGEDKKFSLENMQSQIQKFYQELLPKAENRLWELYPIISKKKAERAQELKAREFFFQENYPHLLEHLQSAQRKELYKKVEHFWKQYFFEFAEFVAEFVKKHSVSNYIRVFFDVDVEFYQREYELYILPRIFNVNDYNQIVSGQIIGLPAYDVSMNAKKPFFELKTMKTKVPTRVTLSEALHIKDLYKWLEKQGKYKNHIYPFHEVFGLEKGTARQLAQGAYHLRIDGNGSVDYFDNVPFKRDEEWSLDIDNVLRIKEEQNGVVIYKNYQPIEGPKALHKVIGQLFFGGFLQGSFLNADPPKVKEHVFTSEMQSVLVMTRQALYDYIYKGTNRSIVPFLQKYSLQLIEVQLLNTAQWLYYQKIADAYHLRLALIRKLGLKEEMGMADVISDLYESLSIKLKEKETLVTCDNEEEFFFLAGQLAYYLLYNSEAHKKNYGMAEPILKVKNVEQLKKRIEELFETYSHAISLGYLAFSNGLAMFLGFETNHKLAGKNKSLLIAGLLANNLFLQSAEKDRKNSPADGKQVQTDQEGGDISDKDE